MKDLNMLHGNAILFFVEKNSASPTGALVGLFVLDAQIIFEE